MIINGEKVNRRTVLKLLGGSALIAILPIALSDITKGRCYKKPLRPPGVLNDDEFLSNCIRCGACIKVCPTNGLRPATMEYGIKNLGTPVLEGYCKIYCLACIDYCPVEALKKVEVEEIKLGNAYIDQLKCILCMRCYNECPFKAVKKDEKGYLFIDNEICKGCNLCRVICPVDAITIEPCD